MTEISCHGKGAHYFNPRIRTILDIGGQDSKAVRLDEKGEVIDFLMNDKYAAGTGRFLEAIVRTLEVGLDELGPMPSSQQSKSRSPVCVRSLQNPKSFPRLQTTQKKRILPMVSATPSLTKHFHC